MAAKAILNWNRSLLRAGDRVCVAISGGADSTALLLALADANAGRSEPKRVPFGLVLSAAHVHHGLRGAQADADEAFVRALCERLQVPLTVFAVNTSARQTAEREGLEEAARALRYEALKGLLDLGTVDKIATAHTLDDQAETVVMKLLRGAWTDGLGGVFPVVESDGGSSRVTESRRGAPGRIVRPLLGVRRAEIEAYLRGRGQAWREDSSNQDRSLLRNRVRHELMPVLRGYNPGVAEALARTAEIARDEEAYWQAEVGRVLPQLVLPGRPVRGGGRAVGTATGERSTAVELSRLDAMHVALRRRVLRAMARDLGVRLSAEETAKVMAMAGPLGVVDVQGAAVGVRIGSRLELHDGLRVERSARELRLWRQW